MFINKKGSYCTWQPTWAQETNTSLTLLKAATTTSTGNARHQLILTGLFTHREKEANAYNQLQLHVQAVPQSHVQSRRVRPQDNIHEKSLSMRRKLHYLSISWYRGDKFALTSTHTCTGCTEHRQHIQCLYCKKLQQYKVPSTLGEQ